MREFLKVSVFLVGFLFWSGATTAGELDDRLAAIAETARSDLNVPGVSLAAVLPDGTEVVGVAGFADAPSETLLTPDHRFLAGSTGKVLFSAMTLNLVDDGRLDLDAKLSNWLGDRDWFARLPNGADITIRHLMNHTAGLTHHYLEPAFMEAYAKRMADDPDFIFTPEESVQYILDKEPPFAAGEGFHYSDTDYVLVAMAVEQLTGRQAYDLIDEGILDPLGLDAILPQKSRDIPNLATGHWDEAGNFFGIAASTNMDENGELRYNPAMEWAGGGFASTPLGLAKLAHALYTRQVVTGPAYDALLKTVDWIKVPSLELRYGLGVIERITANGRAIGHSGFYPGYQTEMYYYPDDGVAFVVMINQQARANMFAVSDRLATQFMEAAGVRKNTTAGE